MNKKNINFILKKYLNFQGRKKKEKFLESGVEMAKSHCTVYHRQQYYRYVITQHMLNSQFIFLKIGFFICKKVNSYKLGLKFGIYCMKADQNSLNISLIV